MVKSETKQNNLKISTPRILTGVVTSDKMKDTVVVKTNRYFKHPKYQKSVLVSKKYHAHNPGNTFKIGDTVSIKECKPFSKTKHFIVITESVK